MIAALAALSISAAALSVLWDLTRKFRLAITDFIHEIENERKKR